MWEDPRPERIRELESRRSSPVGPALVAIAAIAGVLAIMINADLVPWEAPDTPAVPDLDTPSEPAPPATDTRQLRPAPPAPTGSSRTPTTPRARTVERGNPDVLQQLTQTCRYWTEQNTQGQYAGYQQMACNDMTRYATKFGMTPGPVAASPNRPEASITRSQATAGISVAVDQCEHHGFGSIKYRQCRAGEKNRLTALCRELRAQSQSARGSRYEALSLRAQATCRAADRYEIVR